MRRNLQCQRQNQKEKLVKYVSVCIKFDEQKTKIRRSASYKGLVKLAGNMPFSVPPSFTPISHPSSFKWKQKNSISNERDAQQFRESSHLILWVVVLHNVNDVTDIEAQLIAILSNVFVSGLNAIQHAWWQIRCCGTCNVTSEAFD